MTGQHEFRLEHRAIALHDAVERGSHPADHRVADPALDVFDGLAGCALVPAPIERFDREPKLDEQVARIILRLRFAPFLSPQSNESGLVVTHDEIAVELGVPFIKGAAPALTLLRDVSLRRADANVVLEQRMAERLRARGVPAHTIHVIPNWSDDEAIAPIPAANNRLRRAWGLADKFVIGYSGNLGRAHRLPKVSATIRGSSS